jgi:hypothetical protein
MYGYDLHAYIRKIILKNRHFFLMSLLDVGPELPDFSCHNKPKRIKCNKFPLNYQWAIECTKGLKKYQRAKYVPNGQIFTKYPKKFQLAVMYFKRIYNIPTFSIPRPIKIYPNWDFWFENARSGNPGFGQIRRIGKKVSLGEVGAAFERRGKKKIAF